MEREREQGDREISPGRNISSYLPLALYRELYQGQTQPLILGEKITLKSHEYLSRFIAL
jgi:hypothetical protein